MNLKNQIDKLDSIPSSLGMRKELVDMKSLHRNSAHRNYNKRYWHSYMNTEEYRAAYLYFKSSIGNHYNEILSKLVDIFPKNYPIVPEEILSWWTGQNLPLWRKRLMHYYFDENNILQKKKIAYKKYSYKPSEEERRELQKKKETKKKLDDIVFKYRNDSSVIKYVQRLNKEKVRYEYYLKQLEFISKNTLSYKKRILKLRHNLSQIDIAMNYLINDDLSLYQRSPEYYETFEKDCHHVETP